MNPYAGHTGDFSELDDFGKDAVPQHAFALKLDVIPNGDHDCEFVSAAMDYIIQNNNHLLVARTEIRFVTAGGRTIEKLYYLTEQKGVNAFMAEMGALRFAVNAWGSAPGKTPLKIAIPDCIARLAGMRFRALKTSRFVPGKEASMGMAATEDKTFHDLRITCPLPGSGAAGAAAPNLTPPPQSQPLMGTQVGARGVQTQMGRRSGSDSEIPF